MSERDYYLRNYSDAKLLEELARRCNHKQEKAPVARWCHDCMHFKTWDDRNATKPMPENYNPCAKKHKMYFRMPQDYPDASDESGFYRPVCKDRVNPEPREQ